MGSYLASVDAIDNTFFRRGVVVAVLYAVVDALILFFGSPFVPFRLIGVVAAYYAIQDTMLLREAGIDWGLSRYLVFAFVGAGGFLGYAFYAYRRAVHLSNAEVGEAEQGEAAS
ncbi:MAG: hypothetical protein ABEJ60_06000 [Halodesulfurarchaeum sp.]